MGFTQLPQTVSDSLLGQPMDGAIVLDQKGKVRYAGVKLEFQQQRWVFKKHDGQAVGTRHASALAAAVWLSNQMWPGVVFVRSEGGGLHCIFDGGGGRPPKIYHVETYETDRQVEDIDVHYVTDSRHN